MIKMENMVLYARKKIKKCGICMNNLEKNKKKFTLKDFYDYLRLTVDRNDNPRFSFKKDQ